jgi:nicotinamidase-related amidase
MSRTSTVRPDQAAVVVIDIQERLLPAIHASGEVERCASILLRGAGHLRLPILLSEQYPKSLGPTVGPIAEALADASESGSEVRRIEKTTFSCAGCDEFSAHLRAWGTGQAVLCGIEAHI